MFSKRDIARYYDLSEVHFRLFWNLDKSMSLHYGYWDASTKNFHDALLNLNKVLSDYAHITKDDVVLDAGCGVGGSSVWLAENIRCKVTGISLNEMQVKNANAYALQQGVQDLTNFRQKDYTQTGFESGSFDVIWAIESVCHVPDKTEFITEAFRLLKKGGRLIMADFFKKDGMHGTEAELIRRWANGWVVEDYATKESFEQQLKQSGFTNIICRNATTAIMRSAKRLYMSYFIGIVPAYLYRIFKRNATELAKKNVDTAYLQYITLKKNLWFYGIMFAEKR